MERRGFFIAVITLIIVLAIVISSYLRKPIKETDLPAEEEAVVFSITSSAFKNEERIPQKYTCDGEDLSPPLSWIGAPEGTQSYCLIVDDPDAPKGVFTHWVLFDLPANIQNIPEGVPKNQELENGGIQGENSFRDIGYGGPCPPSGKPHRYRFHIYALDLYLNLEPGSSKQDVLNAIEGHVLSEAEIIGIFSR